VCICPPFSVPALLLEYRASFYRAKCLPGNLFAIHPWQWSFSLTNVVADVTNYVAYQMYSFHMSICERLLGGILIHRGEEIGRTDVNGRGGMSI
jgi:hypothetical protein